MSKPTDFPDPAPPEGSKKWPQHPEQANRVVLADTIYMGNRVTFNPRKNAKRVQEKVTLIWQSEEVDPDTGKRYEVGDEFTYSAYESASLPAFLSAWLGSAKAPTGTEEERLKLIKSLPRLVGLSGYGTIAWTRKGDKTYINVKSVAPLGKGMAPLTLEGYTRSDWYAKKQARYVEEVAAFRKEQEAAAAAHDFDDVPEALGAAHRTPDDDLPFAPDAGIV